jgi:hypothetical protein
LELQPPLSSAEIDALEGELPCRIPEEIRELLATCAGFGDGGVFEEVDFTARGFSFDQSDVFPHGHPIAADGFGNFWVVDLLPESTTWGPIYFACHDPPVVLLQSPNVQEFVRELFRFHRPPYRSLIDDVHEDRLFEVWRRNPGVKTHAACLASGDQVLAAFARECGPKFEFIDMREAAVGFGFSWGRRGRSEVRRYGHHPVFAYRKPDGLWARLTRKAG